MTVARLEARHVTFGYAHQDPLFEDWNATFEAGQICALVGPSGRGKSTLMYLLGLMVTPREGGVWFDGVEVSSRHEHERARLRAAHFGFVFQDALLDSTRTVLDNVIEGALYRGDDLRTARTRGRTLLTDFGVALRADAKPGQVSGGQAQRIALCRALLGDPTVLLADEPTGNLDAASADTVFAAFRERAEAGASVVLVTHDMTLADRCDAVISL